jgi:ABC-type phosphate transport system substrate-binding protein
MPFKWTPESFPRLDGSTATIPLGQAVAAAFLGLTREETEPYIAFSGTDPAYEKLANGETDLLIVYEASPETLEYYAGAFDLAPIGRDALVFLINKQNPVNNVTAEQIAKIYSADGIANWREVGGEDGEIRAYQRNTPSGSQTMMEKLVMQDVPLAPAPSNLVIGEMGGLVDMIASYDNGKNAVGYNVYYYVTRMKQDENVKLLSIGGVAPSPETIGSGEYPFVNDFYAVIRKDAPKDSPERLLYGWLQTADAKKLMTREGYVPIAAAPPSA